MTSTGIKMASFRVDQEKWSAFIEYAREHNTTATGLILNYIDSCLCASNNGIMTKDRHHDSIKNNDNILESLKDVQNSLVKKTQEHDRDIANTSCNMQWLAKDIKMLKTTIKKLEETVQNIASSVDDDRKCVSSQLLENGGRIDQLNELITTTRTQVNECQIGAMTREQLMKMLVKKKIKFGVKATKADLIELALENGIIVI